MAEVVDSVKYPSLPSNYVSIAHLQERWLKEKGKKQQEKENEEKEKQYLPLARNGSAKGWREVGKEAKLKMEVDGARGKKEKRMGCFVKRETRVERVLMIDVGSVGKGGKSSKGKCKEVEEERDGEKEKVSVDVKGRRTSEKVRVSGAFRAYADKEVEEVATVCGVEVVGGSNVDRGNAGKRCGVRFRGKKHSGRKMGDGVGEVSDKADIGEQSGQERNAEKEKVKVSGAYGDKEVEEVATVCAVEVVGESKVDREITGKKCRVGFRGKKNWRRRMGDGVGQVSDKMDSGEQSGKQHNADKEEVSVDVKGRTNEKVKVSGAFRAYGDKEVEEVTTVYAVEVVGENKVDREIAGQKCKVGFRGGKRSGRKMGDGVGEVSDKADKAESVEQSGQEHNAEKEEVLVDVKLRTNEKVSGRGAFRAYGDKSIEVPLIDSEAGLKMKIERDLGDLSLSNRRYGHGRSSVGVYDDKRRYASSRRYEPRKMLKQRDSSFEWVKKGESSNANVAEVETQVDFSGQSTGRSKLFSQ